VRYLEKGKKMAETNEHSINTCETAPLLQEHEEESVQPLPANEAGKFRQQTKHYEDSLRNYMSEYVTYCFHCGVAIICIHI
jgi:hypothetical protein